MRVFEAKAGDLVLLQAKVLCNVQQSLLHIPVLFSLENSLFPHNSSVRPKQSYRDFSPSADEMQRRKRIKKGSRRWWFSRFSVQWCSCDAWGHKILRCTKTPGRHRSVASCWLASVRMNAISPYARHFPWCSVIWCISAIRAGGGALKLLSWLRTSPAV